ncbi:MAG: transcription factor TFIIIC [Infirmifilum sp.]
MSSKSKISLAEENIEKLEESSVQFELLLKKVLETIKNEGESGILQKELWKKLGLDSRKGLKILRKLEDQGLIEKEQVIQRGRKTYIIRAAHKVKKEIVLPEFLDYIPCFYCKNLARCASGEVDFLSCPLLRRWLDSDG